MKNLNIEKCMRIISELVSFCHQEGAEEFTVNFTHSIKEGIWVISVSCPMPPLNQELLDRFAEQLNIPRQHEIEQDYWELCGEAEMSGELTLVGMMIDDAKVGYRDGVLYIHVKRKD